MTCPSAHNLLTPAHRVDQKQGDLSLTSLSADADSIHIQLRPPLKKDCFRWSARVVINLPGGDFFF